jgi:hypothetical protein
MYCDSEMLSDSLSSMNCFKLHSERLLNGLLQRNFPENRAELLDTLQVSNGGKGVN